LFLHHDNAPAHTAFSVQQFLAKNKMDVVSHPPICPISLLVTFLPTDEAGFETEMLC